MAQQIPWAILFFALGGVPWLVWGIALRVAACVTGHWLVGYFAHNRGPRSWHVEGAGVQGYNVPYCGLITMGEAWHNNHHAFPGSARLGLRDGEIDPGWWVLCALRRRRPGLERQDAGDAALSPQSGSAERVRRGRCRIPFKPEQSMAHCRRVPGVVAGVGLTRGRGRCRHAGFRHLRIWAVPAHAVRHRGYDGLYRELQAVTSAAAGRRCRS